jgi:hypothetical protein
VDWRQSPDTIYDWCDTQQERRAMSDIETEKQASPSADLLWGAQAVADFLGVSTDRIYYFIRKNSNPKTPANEKLPIGKLGRKTVVASRKKLQRAIADTLVA